MVPIDDGGLISGFSLFATTIEEARVLRDLAVDEGLRPVILEGIERGFGV